MVVLCTPAIRRINQMKGLTAEAVFSLDVEGIE